MANKIIIELMGGLPVKVTGLPTGYEIHMLETSEVNGDTCSCNINVNADEHSHLGPLKNGEN